MALKKKITKAEFDGLPSLIQAEYKADGDDYALDVDGGLDDPGELRRARDREKAAATTAREEAARLKTEIDQIRADIASGKIAAAKGNKDIATLEAEWQVQKDAAVNAEKAKTASREAYIVSHLVDTTAAQVAERLAGAQAALLLPHIKSRLQADLTGEVPATRVLDATGKPSAASVTELETEFRTNPAFAAIIVASKGSGGGAPGGRQGGGGGSRKKLADMDEAERVAYHKEDPTGFAKESAAVRTGPRI